MSETTTPSVAKVAREIADALLTRDGSVTIRRGALHDLARWALSFRAQGERAALERAADQLEDMGPGIAGSLVNIVAWLRTQAAEVPDAD